MRVLAVLGVLLLAACEMTPPREVDPPVELPEAFSDGGAAALPDRWWTTFDDPVLATLVDEAVSGSFTLAQAWDRLEQARAIARQAGAALSPTLGGTATLGGTWARTRVQTPAGEQHVETRATDLGLGVAAAYEIDLWKRLEAARDAAELDAMATEEDLHAAAMALSARVAATWFQLVEQYDQIDLLAEQIRTNEQVLELITLRFRRGQSPAADVLRQRQLVESRRGEQVRAREAAEVLSNQLAVLLGRAPGGTEGAVEATLVPLPPRPETGLPVDLLARRPDVRGAWLRVRAADRRVAVAVADRYPRLSLTGRLSTGDEKVSDLFRSWFANLAANLTAPILDGGRREAEVDRTRAVASERLNGYGQTILEALEEVESALVSERRQLEFLESLEVQLELSRQILARLRDRYLGGTVAYISVLEALATSQALERTRLAARRELLLTRIDLCRALGGGWPLEPPTASSPTSAPTAGDSSERNGS
jgi:NodT family efflux transporter outer membrane factor (OMF) lipoprotein